MKKTLAQILGGDAGKALTLDIIPPSCNLNDIQIENLEFDSRNVKPLTLFFALPGTHTTGAKFIPDAIRAGACAVIYEGSLTQDEMQNIEAAQKQKSVNVPLIKTADARKAMSPIAASFYDNPSAKMTVYGVTGTEGKSSTVSFIWQLLTLCGIKAGFISTVQYSLGDEAVNNPEHQTTPEATIVQRKLYQMLQNGCTHAVIESSSHGLSEKLNRLGDVQFDCAVFMNVTLEHLEFHKTYEQYKSDKANLFRSLDRWDHGKKNTRSLAIINAEDDAASYFAAATKAPVLAFKRDGEKTDIPSDIPVSVIKNTFSSSSDVSFTLSVKTQNHSQELSVTSPTPGAFNAFNITAAMLSVNGMTGIDFETLAKKAASLKSVTGRMTVIDRGQPFEVIVDYAHTPSSFQTVFPPIRQRCKKKIIAVFGSAGERDVTKRPLQGSIAASYCDTLILTDEDPRQEDSLSILKMIAEGAREKGKQEGLNMFLISDRKQAIRKAFSLAQKDDIVLLLGKSHENSIIYKDYTMPYDEIAEAKKALGEMGFKDGA